MTQRVVGVKFCGGCNPRYDRVGEMEKTKDKNPHIGFEAFNPAKEYEKVLLICGCERTCLRFREDLAGDNRLVFGSAEEFDGLSF